MKDYDLSIQSHPGKANVVTGVLSRKSTSNMVYAVTSQAKLIREMEQFKLEVIPETRGALISAIIAQPVLVDRIRKKITLRPNVEEDSQ